MTKELSSSGAVRPLYNQLENNLTNKRIKLAKISHYIIIFVYCFIKSVLCCSVLLYRKLKRFKRLLFYFVNKFFFQKPILTQTLKM